jgi:hypothetical protein
MCRSRPSSPTTSSAISTRRRRRGRIFAAFALLAVAIGCLGLFGLAAFTAERRTKEIGIRKVLGARTATSSACWSGSSAAGAARQSDRLAVAWWAMRDWLNGFDLRIAIDPWLFAGAGLLALVIARGDGGDPRGPRRAHPPDPRAALRMKERNMRLSLSIMLLLSDARRLASASAEAIAVAPFNAVQLRTAVKFASGRVTASAVSVVEGDARRGRLQRRERSAPHRPLPQSMPARRAFPGRDRHAPARRGLGRGRRTAGRAARFPAPGPAHALRSRTAASSTPGRWQPTR